MAKKDVEVKQVESAETSEKQIMNRTDLNAEVFAILEEKVPKKIIEAVIKAEEKAKLTHLAKGANCKVQLIGFGTYERRVRAARTGRNPQTGEQIDIAESHTIAFNPGKNAKSHVN